jgi:hypothetical protein
VKKPRPGKAAVSGKDCGQWGKVKVGGEKQNGTSIKN